MTSEEELRRVTIGEPELHDAPITLTDYDPAWPELFAREQARIRSALGRRALLVEHAGSTSVPGLAAKPIIDLQVSVTELDTAELERRLSPLGYRYVPFPDLALAAEYPFFGRPADGPRTHHIHACIAGGAQEHRHLAFRDYLRAHPDEAAAYATLKRDLATRFREDREGYIAGKDEYVKALEQRALAWAAAA
jgi:GrpB-like predicted nucleotidyltransferase (UPF0157 family)